MAAQSTAEASKREVHFHVESQRIAEGTISTFYLFYQPISRSFIFTLCTYLVTLFDLGSTLYVFCIFRIYRRLCS
jgi:hypothetical protein